MLTSHRAKKRPEQRSVHLRLHAHFSHRKPQVLKTIKRDQSCGANRSKLKTANASKAKFLTRFTADFCVAIQRVVNEINN